MATFIGTAVSAALEVDGVHLVHEVGEREADGGAITRHAVEVDVSAQLANVQAGQRQPEAPACELELLVDALRWEGMGGQRDPLLSNAAEVAKVSQITMKIKHNRT